MHLLSNYALQAGQKISSMRIMERFFPLPFKRYITFQPFSKPGKSYDYWASVLEIIHPILEKNDIKIVQLGAEGEPILPGCFHLQGQTNIGQVAYLIKNAMLHLGCDSFQIHLAGHYDIPLVGVYSNCNYAENVSPFFGNPRKQKIIKPNVELKPSFAAEENPKSINTIYPETIAREVIAFLGFDFYYPYRTVFIGQSFHHVSIEAIPGNIYKIENLVRDHVVVRMDYEFNEAHLGQQLQLNKCTILTDKPIQKDLIAFFRPQIVEVIYLIGEDHDPKFPEMVRSLGIPMRLASFLDDDKINLARLDYFDIGIIAPARPRIPDEVKDLDSFYYRSCKFTLAPQKIFNSKYAWKNGFEAKSMKDNWQKFEKNNQFANDFWVEVDNFHILVDA